MAGILDKCQLYTIGIILTFFTLFTHLLYIWVCIGVLDVFVNFWFPSRSDVPIEESYFVYKLAFMATFHYAQTCATLSIALALRSCIPISMVDKFATKSMSPALQLGDLIFISSWTWNRIRPGSIVAYKREPRADESHKEETVGISRVIRVEGDSNSRSKEYYMIDDDKVFDGQHWTSASAFHLPEKDMLGKIIGSVPYLGFSRHPICTSLLYIVAVSYVFGIGFMLQLMLINIGIVLLPLLTALFIVGILLYICMRQKAN